MSDSKLVRVREHVTKGRIIVARQRQLITRLQAARHSSAEADDLLVRFEASLRIFEEDLQRLEDGG